MHTRVVATRAKSKQLNMGYATKKETNCCVVERLKMTEGMYVLAIPNINLVLPFSFIENDKYV